MLGALYSGAVSGRLVTSAPDGDRVQARDPKALRPAALTGRPAFGAGPIARTGGGVQLPAGARLGYPPLPVVGRGGFAMPNLRRNVCPHFYMTGTRGAIPIQAPHLLKALIRQDQNVSRCQLRGGVHLEQGYINDVCLTPRFNQCVFYEDELTKE